MKKSLIAIAAFALASVSLTACGGSNEAADEAKTQTSESAPIGEVGFDVSNIQADPEVEALVPENIKAKGVLENGAATDYAPAEFRKEDGQTPTGYDIDMVKAIAKVMGLKEGVTTHSDFDSLIPQIGSKFDIGASAFTITPERLAEVNMVSYAEVGFAYAVKKGNPTGFDVNDICGKTIGVQTGTAQHEYLEQQSAKCESEGKAAIEIKPHKAQTEVTQKVMGGQYDATVADSPVIGYAVALTDGGIEKIGEAFDTAQHGVVIAKDNEQLAKAVEAAINKLMADGTLKQIFALYGADDILLDKAQLNPSVG